MNCELSSPKEKRKYENNVHQWFVTAVQVVSESSIVVFL